MSQDSNLNPIAWNEKAIIGASGGLSLVILKLIEADFFLTSSLSEAEILARYLTYIAYLLLGIMVAIFFTDSEGKKEKVRKNAFISGLVAPSLLLALLSPPNLGEGVDPTTSIQQFGEKIQPSNFSPLGTESATDNDHSSKLKNLTPTFSRVRSTDAQVSKSTIVNGVKVLDIVPDDIEKATFAQLLLGAIGRNPNLKNYVFVVGKTTSQHNAVNIAVNINSFIKSLAVSRAIVIHPKHTKNYYISIGEINLKTDAKLIKRKIHGYASKILFGNKQVTETNRKIASSLLLGTVVFADDLLPSV
ncbi:hypothetical protein [Candidatus Marithrix sp. Canyon 246]|uniref:hypothetical protein n=1 Tax=Candidatus Marithrix sp. Canyon 246 TaxID=1827136 RepID=UPI000849F07C|nr:hypothetical protein [Candidatus Marithrix sp. Canyon 246]